MPTPYKRLFAALSINAMVMFFLTYALIDSIDHFHANINRIYMALMMVAPMAVVMLLVMRSMYENRRLNVVLHVAFIALFVLVLTLARTQTPVGDTQFLRSMIPHHSSAIVMCERAAITDPEILRLCEEIVEAQIEEIEEMERMLERDRQ